MAKRRMLGADAISAIDQKKRDSQQQNRNNIKDMAKNMASGLEKNQPDIKMQSGKYDITVNQIKNDNAQSGSMFVQGKTNVTVPTSAVPAKGAVSVVNSNKNSV